MRARRGWVLSGPVAWCLTLVLASSAAALSWTSDAFLTKSGGGYAYPGGLAVSSATVVHAVYEQYTVGSFSAWYRRSANSGVTWGTPIILSRGNVGEAGVPSVDAAGNAVDAVWVEGDDIISGLDSVVMYRRSTDGGLTWLPAVQISPTLGAAGLPRVLHAASGHVLVTWTDEISARIYARLSTNSGASFGATVQLGTTTNRPFNNQKLFEAYPMAAAGTGIISVVFDTAANSVKIRNSTNGGSTWGAAITLAANANGQAPSVAAAGSTVLVGYGAQTSSAAWTLARRSTNMGVSWSSPITLSSSSGPPSFTPVLTYRANGFRAAFERCTSSTCSQSATIYRGSTTGATWGTAIAVSVRKRTYDYPADIDIATNVVVLYDDVNSSSGDVYVRAGK